MSIVDESTCCSRANDNKSSRIFGMDGCVDTTLTGNFAGGEGTEEGTSGGGGGGGGEVGTYCTY